MPCTLAAVVQALGGQLSGDPQWLVQRLASLESATEGDLSFVASAKYASKLHTTRAGALLVPASLAELAAARGACIIVSDPYLYFARLTQWWRAQHSEATPARIDPLASIHPTAQIGSQVSVGPFAVIGEGAKVGSRSRIGAHTVIGRQASVGEDSLLYERVTLGERCHLGSRCIVHSGAVIGADGFGFAPHPDGWVKIEQLGAVKVGDDVEIGANTCIDRGALDDTLVGNGVKLDNLIQIGHNVRIGDHTAMAGCVGVAGTADIGAHCSLGGGAIVLGHLKLVDRVTVSAASVVTRSILKPGVYTGFFPIDDNAAWEKNAVAVRHLSRLRERLRALERHNDNDSLES